ncbi:MAG: hypothetical protein RBU25_16535 [Lentisphaeria bacterium]|jgi:hypothetical protein|nr:hypothetical protein [Lentisphaeria bacterium]
MPDLKDELDALFDNEEKPKEKEAEDKAEDKQEEATEDDKSQAAAKKAKMAAVGARTGGIAARKIPGKATTAPTRAKAPEPEPEAEPAHGHGSRAVATPARPRGQGASLKLVLATSLVLNILILVLVVLLMNKVGTMQKQIIEVKNEAVTATNASRARLHFYTERSNEERALFVLLPRDVTEFPEGCKSYDVPRKDLGSVIKK